jgi:dipeptidase E
MQRRLLLISNSANYGEPYLQYTQPYIEKFLGKDSREILFIPYASIGSYVEYTNKVNSVFSQWGYEIKSIDDAERKAAAVKDAKVIMIGGGNTFHLLHKLYEHDILEPIRKQVMQGVPFIGWSAGSNVACPTIKTTNDMPVVAPQSFDALNLVPFQINPHYTDAVIPNFNGETREERIREFLGLNPEMIVVGLKEGTALLIEGECVALFGSKTIKIFRHNQVTMEFDKNSSLDFLLK